MSIPQYISPIIWKLWQSYGERKAVASTSTYRVYGYDIYSTELFETFPESVEQGNQSIFQDFDVPSSLYPAVRASLHEAEQAFHSLETRAEAIVTHIADNISSSTTLTSHTINLDREAFLTIIKFFTFLRFRNSARYRRVVETLMEPGVTLRKNSRIERIKPACNAFIQQLRYQALFQAFTRFLNADTWVIQSSLQSRSSSLPTFRTQSYTEPKQIREDPWIEDFNLHCWEFCRNAEVYLGVTSKADKEYILPDTCFGMLDESFGGGAGREERDPKTESSDSFFPILPTVSLYILCGRKTWICNQCQSPVVIDITEEFPLDVHLRNAMILSTVPYFRNRSAQRFRSFNTPPVTPPLHSSALKLASNDYFEKDSDNYYVCGPRIYFSSLLSITESISSYDEFRCRWIADTFVDYTRLKQRCRQKFDIDGLPKMLSIKGVLKIHDLTDEVEVISNTALCCGGFSDVWKGEWFDPVEKKKRTVAIKYLRQVMFQNAREEFLRRLHAEVITWHQVAHRNLASLYGLMQSPTSIGMVSLWCDNGTISQYVNDNPNALKLDLLVQIASGVSYLHNFIPPVVHGDLKAGNVLIDSQGQAIITDFGLSKIMSDHISSIGIRKPTSFFAGSTRWMAPELVHAQAEDKKIQVTTYSDIYAYGAVCIEVITGQLPYPYRTNDFSVVLDIIQGIKPYQRTMVLSQISALSFRECGSGVTSNELFWNVVEACWDPLPVFRPKMRDVVKSLLHLRTPSGYPD
ncbi:kinase-like protein [Marasmius fiardii PR-910]|nr:kinase-like protein [Marasmius fiardii PR-910]